ncbi:hypothetical protein CCR94_04435 [Rhodoblastus sphagnicola]|uniref:Uncharacterized protein n=1 Tax=Rhodoblastus sphagnicola TaxID=333368 RepID=A0A2S6NDK6_9HYPH|nr:hypothetical protein CCR94_04435 [Rhodoblastus sphagnicola]
MVAKSDIEYQDDLGQTGLHDARSFAMTMAACFGSWRHSASVWPSTTSALLPITASAEGL